MFWLCYMSERFYGCIIMIKWVRGGVFFLSTKYVSTFANAIKYAFEKFNLLSGKLPSDPKPKQMR